MVANDHIIVTRYFLVQPQLLLASQINARRIRLIGYVDYIDKFGVRHRGGYAREFDHVRHVLSKPEKRNNLVFLNKRGYNYDRPRKRGEGNDWI